MISSSILIVCNGLHKRYLEREKKRQERRQEKQRNVAKYMSIASAGLMAATYFITRLAKADK